MSNFNPEDSGYVTVNKRIEAFIAKYPEGSLQSEIQHMSDTLVIVKARAYRTPDDPRPGIGMSQMPIPGLTNFTRNSEVENAETSAWGRAIAALGFEVKQSVATTDEIANKTPDKVTPVTTGGSTPSNNKLTETQRKHIFALATEAKLSKDALGILRLELTDKHSSAQMTPADGEKLIAALMEHIKQIEAVEQVTGGERVA